MILGEVGRGDGRAPFDAAGIRLLLAHDDLIEHRHSKLVLADYSYLIVLADNEADVIEELHAVDGLADLGDKEPVLARLALGLEADPRIAPVRRGQLFDGDLVEELAPRCGLT